MLDEFIEIETEKKKEKREEERRQEVVEEFERAEVITGVEVSGAEEEAIAKADEVKKSEKMKIIADSKDPQRESRCPYCDEWVGRLHAGALYLYTKHGRIYALADMDHVYEDCKHRLIENIRFLYRMMVDLRARGLKVFAVGKAYDDDLYVWLYDKSRGELEYQGMKVIVFEAPKTVEGFKKFSYGLQSVSPSLVEEALREGKSLTRETF